jgi:hypothetical protein
MTPDALTIVMGLWLGALLMLQWLLALYVIRQLRQPPSTPLADADCPPALVVLCLRGGDPFLHRAIDGLLGQDYPNYRIRIMVDSETDQAHHYVRQALGSSPSAHVEVLSLTQRHATCSYKLSGILAATAEIPEGVAFVALLDGDTIPHRTWLRELAGPIVRDNAAVTTGNRWYFPEPPRFANMLRFIWAAAALPVMSYFRIPWGGTMAVRRDVIQHETLRDRIRHAFSEDTTIGQFVTEQGGLIRFEPSLIIINREDIRLDGMFQFDKRQCLAVRLQHSAWRSIVAYGWLTTGGILYPVLRLFVSLHWIFDVAFLVYFTGLWFAELGAGLAIRRIAGLRGEQLPQWGLRRVFWATVAVFALPVLHSAAIVAAATAKRVLWRGVLYRVNGRTPLEVERDLWEERPPEIRNTVEST